MLEFGFGRPIAISLIWLSTLLVARTALSQAERPIAVAREVMDAVRVDGVLDEPDWSRAPTIGPLVQSEPTQGVPASEDTEVRLLFDSETLYVGILCRDRTPSAIVATQLARDAELDVDDHVTIVLDTFFDQRNGFFFVVNPAGARADGQISNNARELELDWDGIWDARTQITVEGWVAELAIPFKTLRFNAGQTVWGLNVERQIKRLEEISRWSSPGPDMWVANLATAGQLTGLAGIQQGFGLDVRPYVAGSRETDDEKFKVGLDAFKGIAPNLTASLTVNTDFAETEVDEREINLTRFGLFFPEKRSFFLEGTGTFDVAGLGADDEDADLIPFYSRTIGLLRGQEVPILFGAKITGRQSGFNVGLVNVQTRDTMLEEGPLAGQNLLALRVSRNIFEQSSIGTIATFGNPTGAGRNNLIGADLRLATSRFRGGKNLSLDVFGLRTDDAASGEIDYAYGFLVDYPNDLWSANLGFKRIGDGFKPAMGFAPRTGIRKATLAIAFAPRPGHFGIRQLAFEQESEVITNLDGRVDNWQIRLVPLSVRTDSGEEFEYSVQPTFERLVEPFEISDNVIIPPGSYRWMEHEVEASTASKRRGVMEFEYRWANFYGGTLHQISSELILKPSAHFSLLAQMERGHVSLPSGDFVTQLFSGGVDYAASSDVTWSNLIQYDSDSRILGFQSRFRWILKPGNDLFLVVNRGWFRDLHGRYLPRFDRGSAKLQYTIRL